MDQLDEFDLAVAAELRAQRGRTGATLAELVATTGISQSTIQRYLKGTRQIPLSAFRSLATALGANPRELIDGVFDAMDNG